MYTLYPHMKNVFVLATLLVAHTVLAHNGTIKGIVLDAQTKQGLAGANVILLQPPKTTFTDELGVFIFSDLPAGTVQIKVSYIGFGDTTLSINVVDHETSSLKVVLSPQDIYLPNIEISAAGPYNLNAISALDIQTRPVNTAQDILRAVPGLLIAQHAGGGKAEQIFLRGFDVDHGTDIRISVDGMPVNMVSHAHGQGYADLHWLIPELVREVNFAKGNYDAKQGNLATAGSVEFNTASALSHSLFKLETASFNSWRAVAALDLLGEAAKNKNQSAYLASEYYISDGYFDHPQNFNRFNLMGKYTGLMGDNQSLSISFSTFRSRWDASGQIPARAVADGKISRFGAIDNTEGGQTSRSNFNVVLMKNLGNQAFLKNQVFIVKYDFELFSNFTFFLNDPLNGDQIRQKEDRTIVGYNGIFNKETTISGKRLVSEIGLQIRYDQVNNTELSHTKNRSETLNRIAFGDVEEANAGFFVNETLQLGPRWKLNAGLRYDQFRFLYNNKLDTLYNPQSTTKGILSPKLNLFFEVTPDLRLYANAGIGFHSNDTRVVIAQQGRETLPRAFGWEAGAFFKPLNSLLINLSFWQLDLQQEFVYVGDVGVVEPSGRTRRRGFDASARWQILDWLYADVDFNFTIPRLKDEPDGQDYIPLAPTVTSIGGLMARAKNGLFASTRYRYVGDRPANEDNSLTAWGMFLMDVLVGYKKQQFALDLAIQNVFNTEFNEAQFETTSRLKDEPNEVTELHFTPGSPIFLKGSLSYFF